MRKILFFVFVFWQALSYGQTTSISPYSGFGLGELAPQGYDRSFAMGGVGIGFNDSLGINPINPASYSFFKRRNPIFQVGLKGQQLNLTSELNSNSTFNFSLNNFALGFPIAKKGGLVIGVNPATTVGYNVIVAEEFTDAEDYTFPIFNKFEGTGGYTKFYIGGAYRLIEKSDSILGPLSMLSVGVNISYFGGKKYTLLDVIYADSTITYRNTKYTETQIISDFGFDFGVQYQKYIKKTSPVDYISLTLGATVNIPKFMNTKFESLIHTYQFSATGEEIIRDTTFFDDNLKGDSYIPLNYGVGLMIDINKKWQIGVDYEVQNWSNFKQVIEGIEFRNETLTDMFRVGAGIQYNPAPIGSRKMNTSYLKLMTYRMGVRYTQQYLKFEDYQLNEKAVSFGLNLPFSKSQSYSSLNLGIEFGTSGTIENGLIQQDFLNFMIGLTLLPHRFNRWFIKRKYN